MPAHAGAAAFIDGNERTFLENHFAFEVMTLVQQPVDNLQFGRRQVDEQAQLVQALLARRRFPEAEQFDHGDRLPNVARLCWLRPSRRDRCNGRILIHPPSGSASAKRASVR